MEWGAALPDSQLDAWLCYWLGVANMADDAVAEQWFTRAWEQFAAASDLAGMCLTAARAVLSKTDSWRTHMGLDLWTERMLGLVGREPSGQSRESQLLTWAGMLRAADFSTGGADLAAVLPELRQRLLQSLAIRSPHDSVNLRLSASQTLMDHAGLTGNQYLFETAVDAVTEDLRAADAAPWFLGVWLVTFGSVTSRYFSFSRRGFPYPSAEHALRAAVAIGEREQLHGVEFGALYHLQLLMKMRNEWTEFATLVERIARIADSRHTTQVAVAADCHAALSVRRGDMASAYRDSERFMSAIEAANEPPIERWPHFVTHFQVLLADRKPAEAARFLEALLPQFDGALRERTRVCMLAAGACAGRAERTSDCRERLLEFMRAMRAANWPVVLINLPEQLSQLCGDALAHGAEPAYAREVIATRRLRPPASRPEQWPWTVRIHVLGEMRVECEGRDLTLGAKAPTRSLDVLRALATARHRSCSIENIYDWLWPDHDGDKAKAACEQALHRLRRLLGAADALVLREGRLHLNAELVWVDMDCWESGVAEALAPGQSGRDAEAVMRRVFEAFGGPILQTGPRPWLLPAAERVRGKYLDLAHRLSELCEARADHQAARSVLLRALDMYPTASRCYERLIRHRLALQDDAGAIEDYQRYLRVLASVPGATVPWAVRRLMAGRVADL
jgi:DNA-binding SARP family transcriptional activator